VPQSIRLRLAVVYAAVLAFVLLVFSLAVYTAVEQEMSRSVDASIAETARHVQATVLVGGELRTDHLDLLDLDPFASPGIHLQVLGQQGHAIAHSEGLGIRELPVDRAAVAQALAGQAGYYTAPVGGERIRVYNQPLASDGQVLGVMQVGKSYHDYDETLAGLGRMLAGGSVLAILLAGTLGWGVAGGALRPIAGIRARRAPSRYPRASPAVCPSRSAPTRWGNWHWPSTRCWPAWRPPTRPSAASWPTPPTSCARR
jgi:two-component system, OmpR family, sensor kinase